jgi:hypothetical protein
MLLLKIVGGILAAAAAGAYLQLGLYLTTPGTPIPLMDGAGQWLAWIATPIVIVTVLAESQTK